MARGEAKPRVFERSHNRRLYVVLAIRPLSKDAAMETGVAFKVSSPIFLLKDSPYSLLSWWIFE